LACACGASSPDPERTPDPLASVSGRDLFERGRALAARGESIRAEQYLTAAIDRGYPEQEAMPLVIRACVSSSRLSSALGYAEPYLRRHPQDWSLRFLVATLEVGLDRVDDARANFEHVVADAPDAPEPHFALAMLLRDDLHLEDEARPLLERYLELAPEGRHAPEVRAALAPSPLRRERAPVEIHRDSDPDPPGGTAPSESPLPAVAPAAPETPSEGQP
jgi:tetratricopeptide (TPR) repeat protein